MAPLLTATAKPPTAAAAAAETLQSEDTLRILKFVLILYLLLRPNNPKGEMEMMNAS